MAHRAGDPTDVVGSRVAAYLLDGLILTLVSVGVGAYLFFSVLVGSPIGTVDCAPSTAESSRGVVRQPDQPAICWESGDRVRYVPVDDERPLFAKFYAASLAVTVLYNIVLQGLTGATLGKRALGLRVVRADGTNAGLLRCFGRTLLLPVDAACCGLVGFLVSRSSRGHRRLGDMVAGTLVISKADQHAMILARSGAALPDRATLAAAAWTAPSAPQTPAFGSTPQPGADAPTWDDARQAYIQFDRELGAWMQWSDTTGAWRPIDT
ncbi:RDD family protein [Aquihabitans sp. G128]|uniref:RDD family protein n=1 Tax=Aquihabitans sp. G128 TaxID=2849779 RepID=UPI001C23094F|nr:RDD family protein [Aquihabitans sp. G128]QXC62384.1 RDD family protein [Aquihabitans sp. G128]